MNPPFTTYEPLQHYYLEVARTYDGPDKTILKTDLYNEALGAPIAGGIIGNLEAKNAFGIEISGGTYEAARHVIGDRAQQGDIRLLPYEDQSIDTLLDFSTLDHIPPEDLDKTLCGYQRVLKTGGVGVIIVWVSSLPSRCYGTPSPNELQYFFNKEELDKIIQKYFVISKEEKVYVGERPSSDWLHQFVLLK